MILASKADESTYALALARNARAWDNLAKLLTRYRNACCGIENPRCKDCGQRITNAVECACFEEVVS